MKAQNNPSPFCRHQCTQDQGFPSARASGSEMLTRPRTTLSNHVLTSLRPDPRTREDRQQLGWTCCECVTTGCRSQRIGLISVHSKHETGTEVGKSGCGEKPALLPALFTARFTRCSYHVSSGHAALTFSFAKCKRQAKAKGMDRLLAIAEGSLQKRREEVRTARAY